MTGLQTSGTETGRVSRSYQRLIAACSGGLFLPLLFPLLTGRVFTRDDLAALHLPFRYLYGEALRAGDSFLWTSAFRSGLYLHGEGEGGLAHPLHLLLYRWLPLGVAFNLEIVSSYVALLAGTGLLLKRLGLSAEAAWFGAMLFAFCGFNLFNLMHVNHIATLAHAPWMLLGVHVLLTSGDGRARALAFGGVALAFGSQLLVGNPQYVWMTFVAVGFMTLCLIRTPHVISRLMIAAGALAAGALVGAFQWLPMLDFAQHSTRVNWSLDQRLSFSLSPVNLVQLWSPFAFQFRVHAPASESQIVHEFIVYNGAFCTVAIAWLLMRWRRLPHRPLATSLLAFAAVAFVLALGRYGEVYGWLAELPGLRSFRAPARHVVLVQLALSGIAAIVFEDLVGLVRRGETIDWRGIWWLALPILLSLVVTGGAIALSGPWAEAHGYQLSSAARALPWCGLVVTSALLVIMAARGIRWAMPVLVVLAAFDLGLWGYSYAYRWGPIQTIADLTSGVDVPQQAQRGEKIRPSVEGGRINVAVMRGLSLATGYGLEPASVLDSNDRVVRRLAGVAWVDEGVWNRVPDIMPRARLLTVARESRAIAADLHAIDIARVALVDRPVNGLSGSSGSAQVVSDRPGSIVVETNADGRQLLVMTERFHGGWRAREDGVERPTLPVYGDYLGCLIEAGHHRVILTFSPYSAVLGLRLSRTGIALTLVITALLWLMRPLPAEHHRSAAQAGA